MIGVTTLALVWVRFVRARRASTGGKELERRRRLVCLVVAWWRLQQQRSDTDDVLAVMPAEAHCSRSTFAFLSRQTTTGTVIWHQRHSSRAFGCTQRRLRCDLVLHTVPTSMSHAARFVEYILALAHPSHTEIQMNLSVAQ